MPDGYKATGLHYLAKNMPPDYQIASGDYHYVFNICRNTIRTCKGFDDITAAQFNEKNQCVAILGRTARTADYIDPNDRSQGFIVTYEGGEFCSEAGRPREARFSFYCDRNIDF